MVEEEAKLSANSINNTDTEMEDKYEGETEEFYEDIEAPKFVDFTVPDLYRPDDRYWFCLRVGCDRKHEEEIDPEAIYKNFVLRVMAARSPNVRLHKALNRNCSRNTKCPLSAPPKSSKSRMSRFAIISSTSQKIGADKEKAKQLPKVNSTPKAKGKQVAAKYLTTPRNKNCIQNQNAFRSVQNPKPPSVAVPKGRVVAKALIFHSPKKAISLKKSVELRTPLTKLCEGMKKLQISSQRKPELGCSSKQSKQLGHNSQKSLPLRSSTRQKGSNKDKRSAKIPQKLDTQINHDPKSLRSLNSKIKDNLSKKSTTKEISYDKAKSRDDNRKRPVKEEAACPISNVPPSTELESCDVLSNELNRSPKLAPANTGGKYLPRLRASCKKNDMIQENVQEIHSTTKVSSRNGENLNNVLSEQESSLGSGLETEIALSDEKENASAFDDNRNYNHNNDQSGRKILGIQNSDRKKVTEAIDKGLKGHIVGAPGMKMTKLKPTHPKPFRLRTDERGILREANLERKNQVITPENEATVVSRFQGGELQGQHANNSQNEIASVKPTNQQVRTKTPTGPSRVQHSKQQELKPESHTSQESDNDLKKAKSSSKRVLQPKRHFSVITEARTRDELLSVIMEASSGKSKSKEVEKPCKKGITTTTAVKPRAPAHSRSLSRGRRLVTIPKEPNFHKSHMPKSCAAKIS